ncbi:Ig-like domain-containing protein [uncultured Photobacterium sp.]|uniref:Ig-like domain-containing protein n=1 Tax=uncultured Photobacterium sp. TaxID=173973 RepID=UPI00261F6F50|nr:Ig-like domain-containing protein [uncultured Photobacterium sp.]
MRQLILASLLLCLVPTLAMAKSVFLTGTIKTVMPKFELAEPLTYYKGVKEYQLTGSTGSNSGCRLTGNDAEAMSITSGDELVCLFEWVTDSDSSWQFHGMDLSGRPMGNVGAHSRSYRISFFSGSSREKITISEGVMDYSLTEPAPARISRIDSRLSTAQSDALTIMTHNSKDRLDSVAVHVEKRPYTQKINMPTLSQSCLVAENADHCSFNMGALKLAPDAETLTGSLVADVEVSDLFSYTTDTERVTYQWDYRPPVIEDVVVHAVGADSDKETSVVVNGIAVKANDNEALVVVSSPHSHETSDLWWLPKQLGMYLKQDESVLPVRDYVTLNNKPVGHLFNNNVFVDQSARVYSDLNPERYGNKYVYRFDVGSLPDGVYIADVTAKDTYDNRSDKTVSNLLFDRLPPEVFVFNKDLRIYSGDPVYFLEHMILTAQDATSRDVEVSALKVNGVDVGLVGEYPMAKALASINNPETDTVQEFAITAIDGSGNSVTRKFNFSFLPLSFSYAGVYNEKYALVQAQDIGFSQTKGSRCNVYETEELAVYNVNMREQLACSIEWLEIPDGLEPSIASRSPTLVGAFFAAGMTNVRARIWMHDAERRKNLVTEKAIDMRVMAPPKPTIIFDEDNMFEPGTFAVEQGQSKIGRYTLKAPSSPMKVALYADGEALEEIDLRQSNRYNTIQMTRTISDRLGSLNMSLWDGREYKVVVTYSLSPDIYTESVVRSYIVPSKRIRLMLNADTREISTANVLPTDTQIGLYDRLVRDIVYDGQAHGDWEVRMVEVHRDRSVSPLTDWKPIDTLGRTNFDLDWASGELGSVKYSAQARLKAPNNKYEHTMLSISRYVKVLKGAAIEGDIKTSRLSGPVPMTTNIQFGFDSKADQDAVGDVTWFVSPDNGRSWQQQSKVSQRYTFSAKEEGLWLVRAEAKNRFTGEITHSDRLQVMAYRKPDLKIIGPSNMMVGMTKTFALEDHGEPASLSNLVVEWSTDGGKTFTPGSTSVALSRTNPEGLRLQARAAYIGYETDLKAWDTYNSTVRIQKARPVSIRIQGERDVEVGNTLDLLANVRPPYSNMHTDIITEFVLNDGTVVDGESYAFTPTEEDRRFADLHTFTVRSWMNGAKAVTYNEATHNVQVWEYQFPEFGLVTKQRIKVAPSTIDVWLRRPESGNLYENFDFSFNGHGKLELTKDSGKQARFTAKEPGLYPITVDVTDDRGNIASFTDYIEVLEPEPITIDQSMRLSNKYQRAPLDVRVRPIIKLGHPYDRVSDYRWYVNGQLIKENDKVNATFTALPVGTHDIKLEIDTLYGQSATQVERVEVIENKPPTCELRTSFYSKTARIEARCNDTDGKMKYYQWSVDGVARSNSGYRISEIRDPGETATVVMRGFDDSGDFDEIRTVVEW